ncbi:ATP-dependent DNA/RNA helicase, partial [Tieghemiomyces parasiticus]
MADPSLLDAKKTFADLELDDRLLQAVHGMKFSRPTLVQTEAIPQVLAGKDILVRACTGSGKTAAYCLPLVHKLLANKGLATDTQDVAVRALILVPSRELAAQVKKHLDALLQSCALVLKATDLNASTVEGSAQPRLLERSDVMVSTPKRILQYLEGGALALKSTLEYLVIDEADLMLSFGYANELSQLTRYLPRICQTLLFSATLTQEIEDLQQVLLRNPVVLKIDDAALRKRTLTQYSIKASEEDKFLLLYVIMKLQLLPGKCVIFVNDIERCYRVRLFLERFSIRSCVLNSELPFNSRFHILEEFNRGTYKYIIATDESHLTAGQDEDDDQSENKEEEEEEKNEETEEAEGSEPSSEPTVQFTEPSQVDVAHRKAKVPDKRLVSDQEYGVARGIDFQGVSAVINFDFPRSAKSYMHRIGRTARGGAEGMGLSFVVPEDLQTKESRKTSAHDETVYARVVAEQKQAAQGGQEIQPFRIDMKQVQGYRYRVKSAIDSVTGNAVRLARIKEVKREILNSERLKSHFAARPGDSHFLTRHDELLQPNRHQVHLKHVPAYLAPDNVSRQVAEDMGGAFAEQYQRRQAKLAESAANGLPKASNDSQSTVAAKVTGKHRQPAHPAGPQSNKRPANRERNDPLKSFSLRKP